MGPPSSGGSTVGEALNILEGYPDLAADRTRALHLFLEASRFSFADRNAYLADPSFFDVPLATLLSDEYAAERRALIDRDARRHEPGAAGLGDGHTPRPSTTHLVVADRRARSSPTRSRSSPPAATASSCRDTGSCSTTS